MKILYLIHIFYPESFYGTEKFVFNIVKEAQKKNIEAKVITYSMYDDSFYDRAYDQVLYKEFVYKDIPIIAFRMKDQKNLDGISYDFNNPAFERFATKIISEEKPDLIHVGHPWRTSEFLKVASRFSIPYIMTLTDYYLMCPKGQLITSDNDLCNGINNKRCKKICPEVKIDYPRETLVKEILQNAKGLFSPSKFLAEFFNKHFKNIHVHVIGHGINYDKIIAQDKQYKKGQKIVFGYAGGNNYIKGLYCLTEAFRELGSERASLKIYGFSSVQDDFIKMRWGSIPNLEICGVFDEENIGKVLSNIDVMVVPSLWYENYPLILHEALASNIPVITSNIGGMSEKIKNAFNGFTFEPGCVNQLKYILQLIVEHPEILNTLKANMKQLHIPEINEEFSTYYGIYQKCLLDGGKIDSFKEKTNLEDLNKVIKNSNSFVTINLNDEVWDEFCNKLIKKENAKKQFLERMKLRIDYLLQNKSENVNYVIWGSGGSGKMTQKIMDKFLPNYHLCGLIDPYAQGDLNGIRIYKPEELMNLKADLIIISTTIGKKAAENFLVQQNLKVVDDYLYGYGL